jgi:protein SCO1/2
MYFWQMNKLTSWVGRAVIIRWSIVAAIVLAAMIWGYFIIIGNTVKVESLPIYGQRNDDSTDHTISNFNLTDQDGRMISQDDFKNKIYVADFFFTTCEGICPKMSDQMERIAEAYKNNSEVLILSHTVKPEEDSVPVLKEYARLHKADSLKWFFVTGSRYEINRLAHSSYYLGGEGVNDSSDFVHTQFFALVDPQKRIRGYYDGTDSAEVSKLINDIAILQNEE